MRTDDRIADDEDRKPHEEARVRREVEEERAARRRLDRDALRDREEAHRNPRQRDEEKDAAREDRSTARERPPGPTRHACGGRERGHRPRSCSSKISAQRYG